ncbi:MAG TPA: D-mannonate epimerase, partial [Kiritimatiellia bacterium]|nr:D-mannonate epimerase [Kiritimatiellia bacterium]HOR97013.1 D-mannonate epimerase [Kiritimatiellia bacterium]HPC49647.1 D-mannonate epimerase [Kiritimatiellia bacterium]HPK37196.1 D-mannonate epimerase [Kiritimatiellia bacterium]HPW75038.1 D-mannonate epimerase [Kiritimatiellia bacterium]
MLYFECGSKSGALDRTRLKQGLVEALDRLGPRQKVLVLPPDFTRFHSQAGLLTQYVWEYYGDRLAAVMPALGTHSPMTEAQI